LLLLAVAAATVVHAEAAVSAGSLTRRPVNGLPVSVALPVSWHDVSVPAVLTAAVLKRLLKEDPGTAILSNPFLAAAGIRFIAGEPVRRGRFTANVNLTVKPLPPGLSLRGWLFAGSGAAAQYVGATSTFSNGAASGLHYESTRLQKFYTVPLLTDIYVFAHGGRVFDFTYTSLAADAGAYLPLFAASAGSIEFSGS